MASILLCSDLDRTILPNGEQDESSGARQLLQHLAQHPALTLAYVSGRHLDLIKQAVDEYQLPEPDYAIGDVGSTIYEVKDGDWHPWQDWADEIAVDWQGVTHAQLVQLFADIDALTLQPIDKQNAHKLSYFTSLSFDREIIFVEMQKRLATLFVDASLIWSIDEQAQCGLLDVLPARATKLGAIRFLMSHKGFSEQQTVFAGDSGNDLPVLKSGLRSVLVRNADPTVYEEARNALEQKGCAERLYLARGGMYGMNGNYSAGVIEGLLYFKPELKQWLQAAAGVAE